MYDSLKIHLNLTKKAFSRGWCQFKTRPHKKKKKKQSEAKDGLYIETKMKICKTKLRFKISLECETVRLRSTLHYPLQSLKYYC